MRTAHAHGHRDRRGVLATPIARLPFVREADEAVRSAAAERRVLSRRRRDPRRRAARRGADAIHPGYGFLSENADFAAGVSPTPGSSASARPPDVDARAWASSSRRKRIAQRGRRAGRARLPATEAIRGCSSDGASVGYPAARQGLRGRRRQGHARRARAPDELAEASRGARARRSAASATTRVFLERYVERPRHVEIQILGDTHGNVVHLVRARVLDPAPPPEDHRGGAVAVRRRRALRARWATPRSRSAGRSATSAPARSSSSSTPHGEFFFLEVNTRLQVEHPVTEASPASTSCAADPRRARASRSPFTQDDDRRSRARHRGARSTPRTRRAASSRAPARSTAFATGACRARALVDSGVEAGSVVGPTSTRCWPRSSRTRRPAPRRPPAGDGAARGCRSHGVTTNRDSLVADPALARPSPRATPPRTSSTSIPSCSTRVPTDARRRHLVTCALALLDPEPVFGQPSTSGRRVRRRVTRVAQRRGRPRVVHVRYRDGADEVVTTLARSWRREGATYWIALDTGGPVTAAQTIADDPRFER